jgi:predicted nucleotidyltransferase
MSNIDLQISQSLKLLKNMLAEDLLGVYLYGSAVQGGLQRYSDLDLFVVLNRETTIEEKKQLVSGLLDISGIYMNDTKPPIELTIVVKPDVNPWKYPPRFDFQYGEWLREEFEKGNLEPWQSKEMPDLAILIPQVLLSGKSLLGPNPSELLPQIPYQDFVQAMVHGLPELMANLESDTRNALLTLARVWHTLETNTIYSKADSAGWAIPQLPNEYQVVLKRAKSIYLGVEEENWEYLAQLIKPCAEFIQAKINEGRNKTVNPKSANPLVKMDKN